MNSKPTKELTELQRHVARAAERLGEKRDHLADELARVEHELKTLQPLAAAAFDDDLVMAGGNV